MTCKPFEGDGIRGVLCSRGFKQKPSEEPDIKGVPIPDLRPDFPEGQRVVHMIYGFGRITKRGRGEMTATTIDFDKHGKIEFILDFINGNLRPMDAKDTHE